MILFIKMRWMILSLALISSVSMAGIVEFSPSLLRYVTMRWGKGAPDRLIDWRDEESKHLAKQRGPIPNAAETMTDLEDFNWYWNNIRYYTDMQHWGMIDYWAWCWHIIRP